MDQKQHQVLFVDDEGVFLETVRELFADLGKGTWHIHSATTTDQALQILKAHSIALAVVDINMPVLDGVQFLKILQQRYPQLKKAVLTGHATEENRSACLSNGAELFIEKPHSPEGFNSVFAMLNELISWTPREGFQGVLRRVGLPDVIQMECLGRNSSVLEIHNQRLRGRIYIEDGNIIHAVVGELTGEKALQNLLALAGGSFELLPFEPPPQRTVTGPWEFLLMEAARVRDEVAADTSGDQTPAVRIKEILICSGHGELLYDWQCPVVEGRLALLQKISRQATLLHELLPLGNFDRLEIQLPDGRAVAQARADRMVFIHASTAGKNP
jgi:CheY-like chemotaxis protein